MIRVPGTLIGIFLLAYVAVHLGYARLEKELSERSCCDIATLPLPDPVQTEEPKKLHKTEQSTQTSSTDSLRSQEPDSEEQSPTPDDSASDTELPEKQGDVRKVDYEHPDFQIIIRRNIFQLIAQEKPPEKTEEQPALVQKTAPKAVPTRLNLTLLGTIMGDEHTSRAIIIEAKQNKQKLYQIGDAVQGAIIESIERGKVILDVFGARETLMMKKREGGGPALRSLPARVRPPEPQQPPDLMEDEIEEDEEVEEEQEVLRRRKPPVVRPHRRVNFRRNPIRTRPDTEEKENIGDEEEPPDFEEELSLPN